MNRLMRPLPLLAIALLVINDHVLKQAYPGVLTGKLSDFAGLFFFPLFLGDLLRRRSLVGVCLATAVVFALVKTTAIGHEIYCVGLGALQWPFRVLNAGHAVALKRVRMTMDATDLVALVGVPLAFVYATLPRREGSGSADSGRSPVLHQRLEVSTTVRMAEAARRMIAMISTTPSGERR